MDHKTLFPVLEMGFCIFDILKKPAICSGSSYWQDICNRSFLNYGSDFDDITTFRRSGIFSMYHHLGDIWFLPGDICKIRLKLQPQYIVLPPI